MSKSSKGYVHQKIVYAIALINFVCGAFVGASIMGLGI